MKRRRLIGHLLMLVSFALAYRYVPSGPQVLIAIPFVAGIVLAMIDDN